MDQLFADVLYRYLCTEHVFLQVFDAAFNEVTSDAEKIILLVLEQAKISEHATLVITEGADLAVVFIDSVYIIGELPLDNFGCIATGDNDCAEI
jgi:hypothetical protein